MIQVDLSKYSKNGILTDVGFAFESFVKELLDKNNYKAEKTKKCQDQGVDIVAKKDNVKYAIQCKYVTGQVGNKAIQEVYAGKTYYGCDRAVVLTNSTFTNSAKELADKLNVLLWDELTLKNLMKECGYEINRPFGYKKRLKNSELRAIKAKYVEERYQQILKLRNNGIKRKEIIGKNVSCSNGKTYAITKKMYDNALRWKNDNYPDIVARSTKLNSVN